MLVPMSSKSGNARRHTSIPYRSRRVVKLADRARLEHGASPSVAINTRPLGRRLRVRLSGPLGAGGMLEDGVDELDLVA